MYLPLSHLLQFINVSTAHVVFFSFLDNLRLNIGYRGNFPLQWLPSAFAIMIRFPSLPDCIMKKSVIHPLIGPSFSQFLVIYCFPPVGVWPSIGCSGYLHIYNWLIGFLPISFLCFSWSLPLTFPPFCVSALISLQLFLQSVDRSASINKQS